MEKAEYIQIRVKAGYLINTTEHCVSAVMYMVQTNRPEKLSDSSQTVLDLMNAGF